MDFENMQVGERRQVEGVNKWNAFCSQLHLKAIAYAIYRDKQFEFTSEQPDPDKNEHKIFVTRVR